MTWWIGIPVVGWAAFLSWHDYRSRRLPNWLTLGGSLAALTFRFGYGGIPCFVDGFAAACVAGAFLILPFLARGAGGGDVKMLFAAGAIVGWAGVLRLLLYTSFAGLALALVMLAMGRLEGARLRHYVLCLCDWRYDRKAGAAVLPPKDSDKVRIPFSIAISIGMLAAMLVR